MGGGAAHVCHRECVGVRERFGGVGTPLPPLHSFQGPNSGHQVCDSMYPLSHLTASFLIFQFRWFLVLLFLVLEGVDLQNYF